MPNDAPAGGVPKLPQNTFIASFDRFNVFAEGGKPNVKIAVTDDQGNTLSIDMTIYGAATLKAAIGAALEMAMMPPQVARAKPAAQPQPALNPTPPAANDVRQ